MRKMKKFFVFLIIGIFVTVGVIYYAAFTPNVVSDATVTLEPGSDMETLVRILRPRLRHARTFSLTAKLKKFNRPRPGKYKIRQGMTNNDLVNLFRSGKQTEINLTFNNASSPEILAGKVSRYIIADSISLLHAITDKKFLREHGFTPQTAILMYIPNTYRFYYTTDAVKFRNRMWKEYRKFWNEERRKAAARLGLTPQEVGILASIVKKESVISSEKPLIAGVYLNRLKKGMKLEADPTAVYAYKLITGDTTTVRRVLNKHIGVDNPYNTYKYAGLPPGPIAMPDIEDLEAVLHPARHQYLYFSADPARPGYHVFAKTYSEHLRNARAYRRYLNRRGIKK